MIESESMFSSPENTRKVWGQKIKQSIIIVILLTLFSLNASSVNWDSPGSQTVDQMLGDDGLGTVNVPNIPPVNLQHSSATQMGQPTKNILSAPLNATLENETQLFKVGATRFGQGRYEESLQAYDKVIQINPQNAVAWNNRGIDLGLLNKYDDALQSFVRATSINSSFAEAWFNLGIAYDFFGEYENAINAYTKATEINPNYEQAKINKNEDINFVRNNPMNPYP
jgi:tetratricopeptide (TPR) repeat protein